ncbi:hypothetical protein N1851_025925 [Merluccius polli]|uniref:Uncharacterized protein n=1 Tax=Merluccius polli TaxID=89951 RepID=A0AA47MCS8_MERPO|nr:hypothetical protein N1851_025925 [Merluccius polli]
MWVLYRTIVVKRELNQKAKLSIYQSIYVPTLPYGHELWVVTKRTRGKGPWRPFLDSPCVKDLSRVSPELGMRLRLRPLAAVVGTKLGDASGKELCSAVLVDHCWAIFNSSSPVVKPTR